MNTKNHNTGINRREFLKAGAKVAASAAFLGLGTPGLLGAVGDKRAVRNIENVILNNGVKMPILGFGTLDLKDEMGAKCVSEAISLGYRLIDTAMIYGNETAVGAGIKQSGIKRKELFVTSKVWVADHGYESTKKAYQTSLDKLGLDYLDLYLIHRPRGDIQGTWKAMEDLYEAGKIRAIGVSNFEPNQLADLIANSRIKPVLNQIETHAYFQQPESWEALRQNGVQMEAWSPFAQGRNGMFTNETIAAIGKKYNKSNAQVCLRWHYQRGIVAIPRSSQKAHMLENLNIFDFQLDDADMQTISTLDLNTTQFPEWG